MLGLAILLLVTAVSFASVFLYQYWKPKYGGLVIKTTPPGATVFVDGKQRGVTPITIGELRSGGHQVKAVVDGYKEFVQQIDVIPYATENLHWSLEPLVPHLSNEQLAEVESWRKKLDGAQKENILLPPPADYNVLYFTNKILAIDPANAYALEVKSKLAEGVRHSADLAYAREDWLEAEKQYKNLALLFPDDISINERLTDIAAKIDASVKDREQQIADWKTKAEAALSAGNLLPPAKDNALDAIRTVQRLDRKNDYARKAVVQLKETLQNRGDTKVTTGDWQGARNDFRLVLQYFPDDAYSKSRLALVEGKLAEQAQVEQQKLQHLQEEQQSRQKVAALRQSALAAYRAGSYPKSVADWQEYLKYEPSSDEAYFYIGAVNLEQKQLDTAVLNFEKCLSLNPNNILAHLNLGILYDRHRGDLARAIEHLKKAKDLGGVEKYSAERLQTMIQDLQDRQQLGALHKVAFPVEHKHTFSSCRGSLRVTEEGIEYKTTETDHSFYETYKGLRGVTVNGEDLSIRTLSSKKYNFRFLNEGDGAKVSRIAARHTPTTE
jgi:tetratricopeptide (TPR) repeat protein